ncbi:Uncharacterised protein [Salmonella enterica subsp. enterica]|uniref:Uncharacterized protein n=1 Tax=Salmonella enterica I TaxID=59201 RepID=A0A379WDJ3_SALET|nr:Uncharacterised protein [Salmonella enterica subsp. enterica]
MRFVSEHSLHHCAGEHAQRRGFVPECAPSAGATGEQVAPVSTPRAALRFSRASCAAYSACCRRVIQCGARFFGSASEVLLLSLLVASRRFSSSVSACKLASSCCNCSSPIGRRRWPALVTFPVRDGLIYVFKYLCGDLPVNLSAVSSSRSSARSFALALRKAANCPCDNNIERVKRRSPARSTWRSSPVYPLPYRQRSFRLNTAPALRVGLEIAVRLISARSGSRTRARLRLLPQTPLRPDIPPYRASSNRFATAIPYSGAAFRGTAPGRWRQARWFFPRRSAGNGE